MTTEETNQVQHSVKGLSSKLEAMDAALSTTHIQRNQCKKQRLLEAGYSQVNEAENQIGPTGLVPQVCDPSHRHRR